MRFTAFCRQVFGCKGFLLNGTKLDLTKIPLPPANELAVEWSDLLKASKTALLQINQAFNISLLWRRYQTGAGSSICLTQKNEEEIPWTLCMKLLKWWQLHRFLFAKVLFIYIIYVLFWDWSCIHYNQHCNTIL